MAFFKLLTVLSVVVAASAASMVLHERRTAVPSGFVRRGAAQRHVGRAGLCINITPVDVDHLHILCVEPRPRATWFCFDDLSNTLLAKGIRISVILLRAKRAIIQLRAEPCGKQLQILRNI
ncbi:hypothetical protein B0H14DRAFT_3714602 [Mycena olivaceomarginata]|nr:hypothetical protein B0H14DRAFT_3714602 [Mycena olivaceomarginata]